MQCKQRPQIWAAGDCASIPDAEGKPYPELAKHAMREAKVLAEIIYATIHDRPLKPFVYKSKGIMASLGQHRGVAAAMGIPLRGFTAWWIRRSYYLLVIPRMAQRIRLVFEWALALFFAPPLSKLDLRTEREMLLRYRDTQSVAAQGSPVGKSAART
jgi:NADH:ubiquinone reductase (H+-translocating)